MGEIVISLLFIWPSRVPKLLSLSFFFFLPPDSMASDMNSCI